MRFSLKECGATKHNRRAVTFFTGGRARRRPAQNASGRLQDGPGPARNHGGTAFQPSRTMHNTTLLATFAAFAALPMLASPARSLARMHTAFAVGGPNLPTSAPARQRQRRLDGWEVELFAGERRLRAWYMPVAARRGAVVLLRQHDDSLAKRLHAEGLTVLTLERDAVAGKAVPAAVRWLCRQGYLESQIGVLGGSGSPAAAVAAVLGSPDGAMPVRGDDADEVCRFFTSRLR
jgi:hypothetical protein